MPKDKLDKKEKKKDKKEKDKPKKKKCSEDEKAGTIARLSKRYEGIKKCSPDLFSEAESKKAWKATIALEAKLKKKKDDLDDLLGNKEKLEKKLKDDVNGIKKEIDAIESKSAHYYLHFLDK